jgi:2,4-dienoyl-CoA reductase-like NADH-dependent reductase (Old Yellow Enzyme family)
LSLDVLFKPFTVKSMTLANRIALAPMTRSFSPGGVPTPEVAAYYRRRAENQVGLLITEGTGIQRDASLNDPAIPRFHGEKELAGWKHVVDEVHAAGGAIGPQLWHVGSVRGGSKDWQPFGRVDSPSGLSRPGKQVAEPMSDGDVADTIAAFASAAASARSLGFDCLELHGAHGYLIDQFQWEGTNLRSDGYGGRDVSHRVRFAADIVRAVRAAVGEDFPVILRLSQWKQQDYEAKIAETPAAMEAWLAPLSEAGVDIFHCSQRRFWEPEFEGSDLNFAGWARKLTGKPSITVGSVGLSGEFVASWGGQVSEPASLDTLLQRMERDEFDMVAVGRALLQDPEWVVKIREGRTDDLKAYDRAALATLY